MLHIIQFLSHCTNYYKLWYKHPNGRCLLDLIDTSEQQAVCSSVLTLVTRDGIEACYVETLLHTLKVRTFPSGLKHPSHKQGRAKSDKKTVFLIGKSS